jgi:hypothetical protein
MEEKKLSPAIKLLELVWNGVSDNKEMWSWLRLNSSMHEALNLAISSGLKFELGDFDYIASQFRWGWWSGDGEGFYYQAVEQNNTSAIKSLEAHWKRKPFIANDIHYRVHSTTVIRKRGRLVVNAEFHWQGLWAKVTSFTDDKEAIIACTYKPRNPDKYEPDKIDRRFRITHVELKAAFKAKKED